jgi:hypothetical protein
MTVPITINSNQINLSGENEFVLEWGSVNPASLPLNRISILDNLPNPSIQSIVLPPANDAKSVVCDIVVQLATTAESDRFSERVFTIKAANGDTVNLIDEAQISSSATIKTIGYNNWILDAV